MKFTPEVIAALQTLKDYAENDFERHRVETLERDLTSPPVAEVIDDNHQRFNGQIYRKQKSGHYHHNFGIHVAIWRYYHGDIPAGYEIHHDNGNPADNSPTNLILLTKSEHRKKHNDNCQGKKYICEYCGKTFYSNSTQKTVRFCSKICASNYRYKFEATYKKICPTCGKEFYSSVEHIKYCSQECSTAGQKTIQLHYCPICGKTFKPKKIISHLLFAFVCL